MRFCQVICVSLAIAIICAINAAEPPQHSAQSHQFGPTLLAIGVGYGIKDDHRGNSIVHLSAERHGFIDTKGKIVIESQWEEAFPFFEGLAAVKQGDKYGFIDKSGHLVIEPQWDAAGRFSEGLARVKRGAGNAMHREWGFIDKSGKVVVEPQWDLAWDFSEGLAPVEQARGKWGFIDQSGRVAIEPRYRGAYGFSEGLAAVEAKFIDKTGRVVIERGGSRFSEGLAAAGRRLYRQNWSHGD